MSNASEKPIAPEVLAALPECLRSFLAQKKTEMETDIETWEVRVEPPPRFLVKDLPAGAILIASNGVGDNLFLVPKPEAPNEFASKVQIYRHEGHRIEALTETLEELTFPPPAVPTKMGPVYYHDGQTTVEPGDEVTARSFFIRKPARITYVPGKSRKNRDMEHHGMCWVGVQFDNGGWQGRVVDPKTSRVPKSIQFVRRSTSAFQEMQPDERME